MFKEIPLPPAARVKKIRPTYLIHHVLLADDKGLFAFNFKKFNDTSDVSDEDLLNLKNRPSILFGDFNKRDEIVK